MAKWLCFLLLVCLHSVCPIRLGPSASGTPVYDVTDYGAKGDGTTDDTAAVRAAARALFKAGGGGTLRFPAGEYITGSFNLTSHTYLEIMPNATVLGALNGDLWPLVVSAEVWPQMGHGSDCVPGSESCRLMHQALVFAWKQQNISIGGGGTINARADQAGWWKCARSLDDPPCNGYGRPHLLMLSEVTDVVMRDMTVQNSPDWTLHFSAVTNLHVHHIHVTNPSDAPNADGIDVDATQNALIEDCYFAVGDDALCVKSGIDYFGRSFGRPSVNVTFRNNIIGSGHGITIGSETSGGVHDVLFKNITMDKTGTGIRLKSQRGRGGVVSNVTYEDIWMKDIEGECVQITLNYHPDLPPTNKTATPVFRNVSLKNVRCDKGKASYFLDGLAEQHIESLTFENVTISSAVGKEAKCDYTECKCVTTSPCPSCCSTVKTRAVALWESMNPGAGGAIQAIVADPNTPGTVYEVSDMEGINKSPDMGHSWSFIEGHLTGEMLDLAIEPNTTGVSRQYAGGSFAAQRSEDNGATWSIVPGTTNNSIGLIKVFPLNSDLIIFCPSWTDKTNQPFDFGVHTNGTRSLIFSKDGGKTTHSSTYEGVPGYKQVYSLEFDLSRSTADQAVLYISAHSGIYKGTLTVQTAVLTWSKLVSPPKTVDGTNDTLVRGGGSRGLALSPDGAWLYTTWIITPIPLPVPSRIDRTFDGKGPKCTNTTISAVFAASLANQRVTWIDVSQSLAPRAPCAIWGFPRMGPRSNSTHHQLLLGSCQGARVGLWLGQFSVQRSRIASNWLQVAGDVTAGFNMTMGWEYRSWRTFAFTWVPLTWSNAIPELAGQIIAAGDMNLIVSNMSDPLWPHGVHSWQQMYCHEVKNELSSFHIDSPSRVWATNGFQSTYAYDMGIVGNYSIQGEADHGILESWDGGRSWTQFHVPVEIWPLAPTRCTAILTLSNVSIQGFDPLNKGSVSWSGSLVLAHAGVGYGASGNLGALIAKPLANFDQTDRFFKIAGAHNAYEGLKEKCQLTIAGLPTANYPVLTVDPASPKRLLVGTERCGLYELDDFTTLFAGLKNKTAPKRNFTQIIGTGQELNTSYVSDLVFINSSVFIMTDKHVFNNPTLYRVIRNKLQPRPFYQVQAIPLPVGNGLASWTRGKQSIVVVPGRPNTSTSDGRVYMSLDGGGTFQSVFTGEEALQLRQQYLPWFNRSLGMQVTFCCAAGQDNTVIVAATVDGVRKGVGVFRGVLTEDGRVNWEDWTGSPDDIPPPTAWPKGPGPATSYMYYSRGGRGRILHNENETFYYIATWGIGVFRKRIS